MIEKLEERVRDILGEISTLPDDVDNDLKLKDLGMDSLDVTEFVIGLEDEFADEGLKVKDEDVHSWKTFGDVVVYVTENVSQ